MRDFGDALLVPRCAMTTRQRPPTASPLAGVTVLDAMNPGVITCAPTDGVATIAAIMLMHGIHAVVLAPLEHGAPPVVTDLELVRAALEREDACAADIAREPVTSVPTVASLDDAAALMSERYVSHLLATAPESDIPAGIVSSFDVVAVLGGQEPRYARTPRAAPARPAPSARTLSKATAHDVMYPGIATCTADASLVTVARCMAEHRVHCLAVAGIERPGQRLTWGLVSDMDVVLALHRGALTEPAANIATTEPIAVEEEDSLDRAAALMVEQDTSHVVVVGRSGLPSGMVSTLDVARILAADA
jgi:CBS domain-containing protein